MYAGAQYAFSEFDISDGGFEGGDFAIRLEPTLDIDLAVIRAGYYIYDRVAIEGRAGVGLSSETASKSSSEDDLTMDLEVEINTLLGMYLVGDVFQWKRASVYVVGGATHIDGELERNVEGEVAGQPFVDKVTIDFDHLSLSYGAGVNLFVSDSIAVNAEWMQYQTNAADGDLEWSVDALSIGVLYAF